MGKHRIPKTFDWVTERNKCSIQEMFKRLCKVVELDCNIANKLFTWNTQFRGLDQNEFTVVVSRTCVIFSREGSNLKVLKQSGNTEPKELFTAHTRLLENGDCVFVVEDKNLFPWQVSRRALEGLLFRA